jgi:hypothetical protein
LTSEPQEKFFAHPIYVVPVLASILFGLLCGTLLLRPTDSSLPEYPITPLPQNSTGGAPSVEFSILNALYFVVMIAVGATLMYFLIKRRGKRTLKFLITFALSLAFALMSMIYFSKILDFVAPNQLVALFSATAILVILCDLVIFKFGGRASDVLVVGLGGALGMFLGANLMFPVVVAILAFIAIYDIIAVFRGPIGKIAGAGGMDQLRGLSFGFRDIQMGLGDLVFYSVLTGCLFINFNIIASAFSIVGIVVGSYITFKILEERDIFPGLPIPIALGIALGFLGTLIF